MLYLLFMLLLTVIAMLVRMMLALLPQERRELLAAWARLYGREHLPACDEAV